MRQSPVLLSLMSIVASIAMAESVTWMPILPPLTLGQPASPVMPVTTPFSRGLLNEPNESSFKAAIHANQVFDVRDYGAVGNGSKDDYTALAAAGTAAHSSGGILFLPPGTYKIASNWMVSSNVNIQFAPGATVAIGNGISFTVNSPGPLDPWRKTTNSHLYWDRQYAVHQRRHGPSRMVGSRCH